LTGSYRIKCVDTAGTVSYSDDISLTSQNGPVKNSINGGCKRITDLTEIYNTNEFDYNENGKSWLIRFLGMNEAPG
jgi:hypothetical protein